MTLATEGLPRIPDSKKGRSGNPKGRPKGTKNLKTDLTEELAEEIPIRVGNRTAKISKQRAILKTLIANTLKGDARAATTLTNMMFRVLDLGDERALTEEPLDADEREILAALEEDLRRKGNAVVNVGDTSEPKGNAS